MLKKKIKEFEDRVDLTKKYPNYFTKKTKIILLSIFGIMILLMIISVSIDGFNSIYVECKHKPKCYNPLYDDSCEFTGVPCEKKELNYGESIGTKPSNLTQNISLIFFSLIILGFIVNDIIHTRG